MVYNVKDFETQKYKTGNLSSFYTSLMNTYRKRHLKEVVFL